MDDRLSLLLTMLLGGGIFAAVGAAFGALVGAVTWSAGRAGGTRLGLGFAASLAQSAEAEFSPIVTGLLVGGADGFAFLGAIGLAVGAVAGSYGHDLTTMLHPAGTALAALALGAAFFGLLAFGIVRGGTYAVAVVGIAGMGGAWLGHMLGRSDAELIGALVGITLATALCARRKK